MGVEVRRGGLLQVAVAIVAAIYVAVLPMARTIALRNAALLLLLLLLVRPLWQERHALRALARHPAALAVIAWAAYLFVFPMFISMDMGVAWQSLAGQWGPGLLAMVAGTGVALVLRREPVHLILGLGIVSCIPNLIHVFLFCQEFIRSGQIRLNFWGREAHHADLGYAAGQSVMLLTLGLFATKRALVRWAAGLLIATCLASTVIASSRAGQAFALLGIALAVWSVVRTLGVVRLGRRHLIGVLVVVVGIGSIAYEVVSRDGRWGHIGMFAQGWRGDPLRIACEGDAYIKGTMGVADENVAMHILKGDGSRLVVLRGGLELSKQAPWGVDGSRQAYQKLLRGHCPEPAYAMAHTHNGWLDTALALGWLGAALYFAVMFLFARSGYLQREASAPRSQPWQQLLLAVAVFWIVRGFTDSVFRDHMLEMQGFVLALAFVSAFLLRRKEVYVGS